MATTISCKTITVRAAVRAQANVPRSSTVLCRGGVQLRHSKLSLGSRAQSLRAGRFTVCASADTETVDEVRSIISEQLGTDLDKVAADAKFVDLGADSLDTVEIMMALEEKFDITLDEEGAEKIATVQEAADMIAAQVAAK
eukprot:CAMPEP_0197859356 /NCGR_PEP_ID=MMETSP1438-20131217/33835_1 /TAXON_ID=1461541 /ORGANISM="Pterosperma sp., Strain CCMP1384" /LENGTH=140 /DNA_ID=CAMNT_0043475801 /DNA_START=76 /DNA_END=498 /DNA_ORIENTATION=+